jgi:hypothetical protein
MGCLTEQFFIAAQEDAERPESRTLSNTSFSGPQDRRGVAETQEGLANLWRTALAES